MVEKSEYGSLGEWRKAKPNDYAQARRLDILGIICEHFGWDKPKVKKPFGYWTKEKCIESARKYKTKTKWRNGCPSSSTAADRNGWVDECCTHMKELIKPNGYWTLERCMEEALKYNGRWEWQKNHSSSYSVAKINKWLDKCCEHMEVFSKPSGYWNNKVLILEEAKKYNFASDFEKGSKDAYSAARRYGWYEEATEHMGMKIKPRGYWNDKEKCKEKIALCTSKEELKERFPSVSSSIRRNGWYYELTSHFDNENFIWTREGLLEEANKYKTTTEFNKGSNGAYQVAYRNGWFNYVTQNLKKPQKKPTGYWNDESLILGEAIKYNTRTSFIVGSPSAHQAARRLNILDKVCSHMK